MNEQRFLFLVLSPLLCLPEAVAEYYGTQNGVTAVLACLGVLVTAVLACLGVLFLFVGLHRLAREEREKLPKIERTPRENAVRVIRNALCMIAGMILFASLFLYLFRNSPEFFSFLRALYKNPITFLPILINLLIPVAAVGIGVMPG